MGVSEERPEMIDFSCSVLQRRLPGRPELLRPVNQSRLTSPALANFTAVSSRTTRRPDSMRAISCCTIPTFFASLTSDRSRSWRALLQSPAERQHPDELALVRQPDRFARACQWALRAGRSRGPGARSEASFLQRH